MARTVLVTGATGGIGSVLVDRLLERGDHVIASDRAGDRLDALALRGAKPVPMDVGDDGSVADGFAQINGLDAVVHCAAVAPLGTVEFTPAATVASVININTLGALRVLQHAAPMLRGGGGRIILISSLWGQVSGPFVSSYAASKHALEALADAARREMRGQNVHISLVEPGVVRTSMYFNQVAELDGKVAALGADEERLYGPLYAAHRKIVSGAAGSAISPEGCVSVIEKCLDARRPKPRYRAGTDAKTVVAMGRLLTDRGLDRVFGLMYRTGRTVK